MDSAPDICAAQLEVLAANGRDDVSEEFLRRYIGRHLTALFEDLGFTSDAFDLLIQSYRTSYWDRKHAGTRVFPGVAEMLALLGGRKSTATIKTSRDYAGRAGAVRFAAAFRPRARYRRISRQARAGCDSGVVAGFGRRSRGVPAGGRFGSGYGSGASRRRADLRGAMGLREPPGDGAVGAGLLDRRAGPVY